MKNNIHIYIINIMCFTKNMSLGFFLLGAFTSGYLYLKKKSIFLYGPILYFAFMEFLQYCGYLSIEYQNKYINKLLSILIYIHIGFQPFIINVWFSNFIPLANLIFIPLILKICFVSGIFWISRLFFWWKKTGLLCDVNNEPGCGINTELLNGKIHLYQTVKLRATNYLTPSIFMHFFLFFIPILFLNVNMFIYFILLLSGIIGWSLSKNKHEAASIWCIIALPVFLLSLIYAKN